jgi:hypothetical protein
MAELVEIKVAYECFTERCPAPAAASFTLRVAADVTLDLDAVVCDACGEAMDEVIPEP